MEIVMVKIQHRREAKFDDREPQVRWSEGAGVGCFAVNAI